MDYEELLQAEPVEAVPRTRHRIRCTSFTPAAPPAGPRACCATTAATPWPCSFSMQAVYGLAPGETMFTGSDIGWAVGHSYIVYGPLLHGCTSVLFEGKPVRTPDAGTFWRLVAQHQAQVMFTAPTAIRAIKKEDPEGQLARQYDLSSLRHLFLAGERCDPATYDWAGKLLGVPVVDHWWQTESGWPMLATLVGLEGMPPPRAGSAGHPVPGYDVQILDEAGAARARGHHRPGSREAAAAARLLAHALERRRALSGVATSTPFPATTSAATAATATPTATVYIMGRVDDVINVAGHRLSTGEMEEILAAHPAVAECAVLGIADALRGPGAAGLGGAQRRPHHRGGGRGAGAGEQRAHPDWGAGLLPRRCWW